MKLLYNNLFIDYKDSTYKLGKLIVNEVDFSQYPFIELFDPDDYDNPVGSLNIFSIYTKDCVPESGVFENPQHITRTIIEIGNGMDIKRCIIRTQKVKSKGDHLNIL